MNSEANLTQAEMGYPSDELSCLRVKKFRSVLDLLPIRSHAMLLHGLVSLWLAPGKYNSHPSRIDVSNNTE